MRACDSEVGIPKAQAPTAQVTIPTQPAARATRASWLLLPKSTIPRIVSATAVEMRHIATKPTKLHTTLMIIAWLTLIERVPTASAIALAASVAPFTKMHPKTRTMTRAKNGLATIISKKCPRVIIRYLSNHFHNGTMIIEISFNYV